MSRPRAAYSWVLRKTKGKEARDGEEDCRRLGRGRQEGGRESGGAGRGAVGAVEVDGGAGEGAGSEADGVRVVGAARGRPGSGGGAGGGPPGSGGGGGGRPFGLRRGERAAVLRRPDALRGSGAVGDGDGAGQGSAGDGALRLPVLREERASAGVAPGRRGVDDADGAADGERAGVGVLLRGGGPAAERGGRGELRGEAGGADDAAGGRRPGAVADGVAVGVDHGRRRGRGGVERRVVRRGAGSPAVEGRTDSVRWTGRHGGSRAAVGDGGAEGEGRRARDDAGSQGRRGLGGRAGRRRRDAAGAGFDAVLRGGRERGGRREGRLAGGAAAAARTLTYPLVFLSR